ncbi:hypothetical protein BZARG_403 [Bizionia argentinensis JUB59]|uniref:Arsenate reductase n=1 Tax=Bizionia argentinensis JUB59 TaxID=1046627 RepID=G2EH16_9FLAO|nr:ArsC/Spx/MgsR family protein [Bizionia argentinensis]EGV42105.2 hypothetical protein BZARG_403 [Bizionia argentinensis JUB59]
MNKVYYLKSCSTCMRIIKEIDWPADFEFQDIKKDPIDATQIEEMHRLSGSYEAFFSKRAKLYKEMDLKNAGLEEPHFKHYLLDHYTFLSRPVIIFNDQIFIGNSKKNIENLKAALSE